MKLFIYIFIEKKEKKNNSKKGSKKKEKSFVIKIRPFNSNFTSTIWLKEKKCQQTSDKF